MLCHEKIFGGLVRSNKTNNFVLKSRTRESVVSVDSFRLLKVSVLTVAGLVFSELEMKAG